MKPSRLALFLTAYLLILLVLLSADAVALSVTVFAFACVHGSVPGQVVPCAVLAVVLVNTFALAMRGWQRRLYGAAVGWLTRRRAARSAKQQALPAWSQGLRPKMRAAPQPSRWCVPPEADDEA